MASDKQISMAFQPLHALMHPDEGIIRPRAVQLFRELKRKTGPSTGNRMPAAMNDVGIAAIAIFLVNEDRNDARDLAFHQRKSSMDAKTFNAGLGLARVLAKVGDRSRSAKSTPVSSGSKKRGRYAEESDVEEDPDEPQTPSTKKTPSTSKRRRRTSLQPASMPDRSAEMNARHAREAEASNMPQPQRPYTPTKSSPLKSSPAKGKGKGTGGTPTSSARSAKRAEKRAEAQERSRKPLERPWMVRDDELTPWPNFLETIDRKVAEAKALLTKSWAKR